MLFPRDPLPGTPWAWKGEFLDEFPGTELALLEKGFHIVYLNFPDQFGSPAAVAKWDALYNLLTGTYGFAPKPALIGLSRGGLYCYEVSCEERKLKENFEYRFEPGSGS